MNSPLVSICIPVYNGEKYLELSLNSALHQTYPDTELIIVDDQSTDSSVEIAKAYAEKYSRIKLSVNEQNLGLVGNWNRCIELANGEWIKFLFQDDLLNKDCIDTMLRLADKNSKFIVCNRKFIFSDDTNQSVKSEYSNRILSIQKVLGISQPAAIDSKTFAALIAKHVNTNFVGEPTAVMFQKSVINQVGLFDDNMVQTCDLEYWYRLASNFGVFYIPETLCNFRVHTDSMSAQNKKHQKDLVDKVVLTHHLLFDEYYNGLRSHLGRMQLFKIRKMYLTRIYEAECAVKKNNASQALIKHYAQVKKRLQINYDRKSMPLFIKALFRIVQLRRKLRSITS